MNEKMKPEDNLSRMSRRIKLFVDMLFYGAVFGVLLCLILVGWSRAKIYPLISEAILLVVLVAFTGLALDAQYLWRHPMNTEEWTKFGLTVGNIFTRKRVTHAICLTAVTIISVPVLNEVCPINTMPRSLSPALFYAGENDNKIKSAEVGIVAQTEVDAVGVTHVYPCSSIEAYGPFEYAGEMTEVSLYYCATKTVHDAITDEELNNGSKLREMLVYFVRYEDGVWMVVKRFNPESGMELPDGEIALVMALDILMNPDRTSYKIHTIVSDADVGMILSDATDGILSFEDTDDGYIWMLSE